LNPRRLQFLWDFDYLHFFEAQHSRSYCLTRTRPQAFSE
jgi:hypothetical protein